LRLICEKPSCHTGSSGETKRVPSFKLSQAQNESYKIATQKSFPDLKLQGKMDPKSLKSSPSSISTGSASFDDSASPNSGARIANTLFLGDLSRFCSEASIEKLFSTYGKVEAVKIIRSSSKIPLGYGFVTMTEAAGVQLAMENLNGYNLCGRPLRIKRAAYNLRSEEARRYDSSDGSDVNSIHVRFRVLKVCVLGTWHLALVIFI
jgi:RNA recognition motif-containing protein